MSGPYQSRDNEWGLGVYLEDGEAALVAVAVDAIDTDIALTGA